MAAVGGAAVVVGGRGDPDPLPGGGGGGRGGVGVGERGHLVVCEHGVEHVHGQEEVAGVARLEELVGGHPGDAAADREAAGVADELARVVEHELRRAHRARQPRHGAVRVDHLGGGVGGRRRRRRRRRRRGAAATPRGGRRHRQQYARRRVPHEHAVTNFDRSQRRETGGDQEIRGYETTPWGPARGSICIRTTRQAQARVEAGSRVGGVRRMHAWKRTSK